MSPVRKKLRSPPQPQVLQMKAPGLGQLISANDFTLICKFWHVGRGRRLKSEDINKYNADINKVAHFLVIV